MWTTRRERRQQLFNQLHNSDDEMHRVSAVHLEMIFEYYDDVLKQAKASFLAAVVLGILGFGVLAYTIYYAMQNPDDSIDVSWIGVVGGGLVQFLSAVAFFVYKRATEQFNNFHLCLERTNRYLMAYNLDELIEDGNSMKDRARHELACLIAEAPMISQSDLETKRTSRHTDQNKVSPANEQRQQASRINGTLPVPPG